MFNSAITQKLRALCLHRAGGGQPLYRRLQEALAQMIRDGVLAEGCRLPPDMQWAREIGVSHVTLAKALNELRKFGLVARHRQSGSYVEKAGRPGRVPGGVVALFYDEVSQATFDSELFVALQNHLS